MPLEPHLHDALRQTPIFASLSNDDVTILGNALKQRQLQHGELLFRQGDQGDSMFILVQGHLAVNAEFNGHEKVVGDIFPGEVVGEMSCIDPAPRSASVSAQDYCQLFELDRATLDRLRDHAPQLVSSIVGGVIQQVTQRLRDTDASITFEINQTFSSMGKKAVDFPQERPHQGVPIRRRLTDEERPVLAGLDASDLELLLNVAPPKLYAHGTNLCCEANAGHSCFIVLQGAVEIFKHTAGGVRLLATLKQGTMVGQMALVDSAPRSATVTAKGDVIALELEHAVFENLLRAGNTLATHFQEQTAIAGIRQLRMANTRLARMFKRPMSTNTTAPLRKACKEEQEPTKPVTLHRVTDTTSQRASGLEEKRVAKPRRSRAPRSQVRRTINPSSQTTRAVSKTRRQPTQSASSISSRVNLDTPNEVKLEYLKMALSEWGMSLEDLDHMTNAGD